MSMTWLIYYSMAMSFFLSTTVSDNWRLILFVEVIKIYFFNKKMLINQILEKVLKN